MCGCRKNKNLTTPGGRRVVSNRAIRQTQLNSQAVVPRQVSVQSSNASQNGMTTEMREVERRRREALLKKLGRI
jgi:hypothetical protein